VKKRKGKTGHPGSLTGMEQKNSFKGTERESPGHRNSTGPCHKKKPGAEWEEVRREGKRNGKGHTAAGQGGEKKRG